MLSIPYSRAPYSLNAKWSSQLHLKVWGAWNEVKWRSFSADARENCRNWETNVKKVPGIWKKYWETGDKWKGQLTKPSEQWWKKAPKNLRRLRDKESGDKLKSTCSKKLSTPRRKTGNKCQPWLNNPPNKHAPNKHHKHLFLNIWPFDGMEMTWYNHFHHMICTVMYTVYINILSIIV